MPLPHLAKLYIEGGYAYAQCPDSDLNTESWISVINPLAALRSPLRGGGAYIIQYFEIDKKRVQRARNEAGVVMDELTYEDAKKYEFFEVNTIEEVEEILHCYLPDLTVVGPSWKVKFPFI